MNKNLNLLSKLQKIENRLTNATYIMYLVFSFSALSEFAEKVASSPNKSKQIFGYLLLLTFLFIYSYYLNKANKTRRRINDQLRKYNISKIPWVIPSILLALYLASSFFYDRISWVIWIQLGISVLATGFYNNKRKKSLDKLENILKKISN